MSAGRRFLCRKFVCSYVVVEFMVPLLWEFHPIRALPRHQRSAILTGFSTTAGA
jgi:hypothetical protein